MGRLAQTEGLTDIQTEILGAVHEFVDKEIVPNAQELEHADEYTAVSASRSSPTRSRSRRSRAAGCR